MDRAKLLKEHGKHARVELFKKFKNWDDKLFYTGTLRGALKRIPPGHEDQYEIFIIKGTATGRIEK
jgi:hypothetical protein